MLTHRDIRETIWWGLPRALWQRMTPNIRLINLSIENGLATIQFFFDGPITEEDEENISEAETELLADFATNVVVCSLVRIDQPNKIYVRAGDDIMYARKEDENYVGRL